MKHVGESDILLYIYALNYLEGSAGDLDPVQ